MADNARIAYLDLLALPPRMEPGLEAHRAFDPPPMYAMPTAFDVPPIEVISLHTPSRRTPTGSKGMSEGGVMGAVGAVMHAVNDALAPFGVIIERQPLTAAAIFELLAAKR